MISKNDQLLWGGGWGITVRLKNDVSYEQPLKLTESAPDVSKRPGGSESVVNGSWWDAKDDEQDVGDLRTIYEI